MVHTDLVSTEPGTVTSAHAAGTNELADASEFASGDLVGAVGATVGDSVANGAGQSFHITEMVDANTVRVIVRSSASAPISDGKWATALVSGTTTYRLWFPGYVQVGNGMPTVVRGVVSDSVVAATTPYGWVQQSGVATVRILAAGDPLVRTEGMIPSTNGRFEGFTAAATTADEASAVVAQCCVDDIVGASNITTVVRLNIRNDAVSYRFPPRGAQYP